MWKSGDYVLYLFCGVYLYINERVFICLLLLASQWLMMARVMVADVACDTDEEQLLWTQQWECLH